jgi:hypothetical protein
MDKEMNRVMKAAFKFFTKEENITFILDPPSIILGDPAEKRILDKDSFFGF